MREHSPNFIQHTLQTWTAVSAEIIATAIFYATMRVFGVTESLSILFCSIVSVILVSISILIIYKIIPNLKQRNEVLSIRQNQVSRSGSLTLAHHVRRITDFATVQLIALIGLVLVQSVFSLSPLG